MSPLLGRRPILIDSAVLLVSFLARKFLHDRQVSGIFGNRVGVMLHFCRPLQETPEIMALSPGKLSKLEQANLVHLHARIGLDPPQKIRAVPGSEMMPAGGIPKEAEDVTHMRVAGS